MPAYFHFREAFQSDLVHLHDEYYSELVISVYDRFFYIIEYVFFIFFSFLFIFFFMINVSIPYTMHF